MDTKRLSTMPICHLAPRLEARDVSPCELAEDVLGRIEQLNPVLNAYVYCNPEQVRRQAVQSEEEISQGKYRGPLHGIPVALKDNIWTEEMPTTAGSWILPETLSAADAFIVSRLRGAGAILIGKTNLSEFAYGTETDSPRFGQTRNPWDARRIPGGSSGGSAAATAASLCAAAIGTDTGGSVRNPAALCGVVGFKPTFGRISCSGVVPLAPSLDHMGPMARRVLDIAFVLSAIAGHDPKDELSAATPVPDYAAQAQEEIRGLRVGLPVEHFFDDVDPEIESAVREVAAVLSLQGVQIEEVSLPHLRELEPASTQLLHAEATSIHQAAGYFPAHASEYAPAVRERLEDGSRILATDYLRALAVRRLIRKDFSAALAKVDALLVPSVPIPAPHIGRSTARVRGTEVGVRPSLIRLNRPSNLTGLPALSVPCGFTHERLPIGAQLIGRPFEEGVLLRLAFRFESATTWHLQEPQL
jgi:aspartyl-tRNA(Asn)/glutamyl-tRNA(Gln) amidotransferase subunit A